MRIQADVLGPDDDGYVWLDAALGGKPAQVNLGHYSEQPAASILRMLKIDTPPAGPDDDYQHINCEGDTNG